MHSIVCFTFLIVLACVDAKAGYRMRNRRQAIGDGEGLWPNKKVFFEFHQSASSDARKAFLLAVDFWKANTCIDFEESSTAQNRISVFNGGDGQCYSYIGFVRSHPQRLSLGNRCGEFGIAAHELAHALGFEHLQSRKDRDDYVTIDDRYKKDPNYEIASRNNNYDLPFDFGSIMMYLGFNILRRANGATELVNRAIKPKDRRYTLTAGSMIVSFYDVLMMNKRYKCEENCPIGKSASCKNSGYPHPRDCSKCVCPLGYEGDCTKYAKGTQVYSTEYVSFVMAYTTNKTNNVKSALFDVTPNYLFYQIVAPEGKRVELTLDNIKGDDGLLCKEHGIEVRTKKDKALTGYRFCDEFQLIDENTVKITNSDDPNKFSLKFTSESNTMSVYVYEFTKFDSFGMRIKSIN